MVKEYETKNLWAIFPPPIASIMQFTAEFIQQKRICLRALWYFFPQHICINWCLLLTFRIGLYTEDLVIALFIGGKKKVQHFEAWQLSSSIKNSSKFTVRANRHSLPPTETRQSLTSAPLCSQTGFANTQRFKEKCSRIHTHTQIHNIYTHSRKTSGECRWWCTQVQLLKVPYAGVDVCLCVRACVDKDLSRKRLCLLPLQTRSVESEPQTTNQSETCSTFEADAHWGEASWLHSNERPPLIPF